MRIAFTISAVLVCCCWFNAVSIAAPAPPPATRPATVSVDAFDPDDSSVSDELRKMIVARRVTLDFKSTPAMTAVAELAKASGYEIRPGFDGWFRGGNVRTGNVTVSIVNQPFWVAMREICVRGNINLYNSGGDESKAIQLIPANYGGGGAMRGPVSIRGPFLVVVSDVRRINTVDMGNPQNVNREIHVQMQTYVEPPMRPMQASWQPVIDEAVDDNGNSMTPPQNPNRGGMQMGRGIAWWGNFTLPYPATNPGNRIAKIKGHIPAQFRRASEPLEIADPLKAAETTKTIAGRRVTISPLKKEGNQYTLAVTLYRDDQDRALFVRSHGQNVDVRLIDAQGREFSFHNSGGSNDGETSVRNFTFQMRGGSDPTASPVKLIVEIPLGTHDANIPFELIDLPLP